MPKTALRDQKPSKPLLAFVAVICALAAAGVFFIIGQKDAVNTDLHRLVTKGRTIQGKVVSLSIDHWNIQPRNLKNKDGVSVFIEYQDSSGHRKTLHEEWAPETVTSYRAGDVVPVLYDEANRNVKAASLNSSYIRALNRFDSVSRRAGTENP